MLKEETFFGKIDKVQQAINRIKLHEPEDGYYVAFSGGKDSVVVLDLVRRAGVKFDVHHNLTGIEPPELIYFIREHYSDVITESPKKSIWQLIVDNGMPPTRLMRYCCKELKEKGGVGRFKITGIRHAESYKRSKRGFFEPCIHNTGTRFLNPIIDWSDEEVWEYIKKYNVPYCKLYDNGWKRIGCMFCPMSTEKEKLMQIEKYPKYKNLFVKTFQKMIDKRKEDGKECSWFSGEECFNWWVFGKKEENADRLELFNPIDFV